MNEIEFIDKLDKALSRGGYMALNVTRFPDHESLVANLTWYSPEGESVEWRITGKDALAARMQELLSAPPDDPERFHELVERNSY